MTLGLLLLHAFPLDADMWDKQVQQLSTSVPVVPVNLPGFGNAPLMESEHWMDRAADVADAALRGTGIDRVIVCGLSMGGYVAFAYLRRHGEKVAGLVLANTRADADDAAARQRRSELAERLGKEGNILADSPPPLLSEHAPAEVVERVRTIIGRQTPEGIARAALAMGERADSAADLSQVQVPVLVITSSADALISPALSQAMADAIPNARLATIEGAGHLSNLEAPDEFNSLLAGFIEQVQESESARRPDPPDS